MRKKLIRNVGVQLYFCIMCNINAFWDGLKFKKITIKKVVRKIFTSEIVLEKL